MREDCVTLEDAVTEIDKYNELVANEDFELVSDGDIEGDKDGDAVSDIEIMAEKETDGLLDIMSEPVLQAVLEDDTLADRETEEHPDAEGDIDEDLDVRVDWEARVVTEPKGCEAEEDGVFEGDTLVEPE